MTAFKTVKSPVSASTCLAMSKAATKSALPLASKYLASSRAATTQHQKWASLPVRWYSTEKKSITERIAEQVKASPVVLYMKGNPKSPQCGFSRAVVEVLRRENLAKYDYYNILEDEELRQGIKDYSSWPTIPQLYIGGEFVGGCDIVVEMHGEGTLAEALQKAGAEIKEH